MGALKEPKPPKPPKPVEPPPEPEQPVEAAVSRKRSERRLMAAALGGQQSRRLTGSQGVEPGQAQIGVRTLLGSGGGA